MSAGSIKSSKWVTHMKQKLLRGTVYLIGAVLMALGLALNTKTDLGTSSVISVPFVMAQLWPINVGNALLILSLFFVAIELIVHWRMASRLPGKLSLRLILDLLQMVQILIFSRVLNGFSAILPLMKATWPDSFPGSIWCRLLVTVLGTVLVGMGAAMTLNMRLIPTPTDGMIQTLADASGRSVGFVKNCVDITCVVVAAALGLLFGGRLIGIGIGTVITAIGTGRVVALTNHLWKEKMCRAAGL